MKLLNVDSVIFKTTWLEGGEVSTSNFRHFRHFAFQSGQAYRKA